MTNILYVHGANSTKLSWAYIKPSLPEHNAYEFEYDTVAGVAVAVARLVEFLESQDQEWTIVSHSLGGVISLFAAMETKKVKKIISLSTPYGGSKAATFLKYLRPNDRLFKDICSFGEFVTLVKEPTFALPVPVKAISTFRNGSAFFNKPNDGVVTLDSQTALPGAEIKVFELNHFEVLMSREVAEEIKNSIWN